MARTKKRVVKYQKPADIRTKIEVVGVTTE